MAKNSFEYSHLGIDGEEEEEEGQSLLKHLQSNPPKQRSSTTTTTRRRKVLFLLAGLMTITMVFLSGVILGASVPEYRKKAFLSRYYYIDKAGSSTAASSSYHRVSTVNGVETPGTQCGSTWQEAQAMGCKFDVMASRWYAPECFFQEVLDEMLAEPWVNFTWYVDEDHTEVFPAEKALAGEFVHVFPNNCECCLT